MTESSFQANYSFKIERFCTCVSVNLVQIFSSQLWDGFLLLFVSIPPRASVM